MLKLPVYLDHNATTPCDPRVVEAMIPFFSEHFGNAASRHHSFGWQAEEAVKLAREQVAALIGSEPDEVIFTSGATESDNLALKGVWERYAGKGQHIITVVTEHKAVLDTCRHLEKKGADITYLGVDADGLINMEELEKAIQPQTILIAVMYANNETGVIQQVKKISDIARQRSILFFTDAAQAVGKIPVNVNQEGIDLMAFSAHKMYGPKGAGALYVRRKNPRVQLTAQMDGGGHERGIRSGTLNVPAIVGFGKACEIAREEMLTDTVSIQRLRDTLEKALLSVEGVSVNGSREYRLPHVSNLTFRYVEGTGAGLIMGFNGNLAVSSGSACTSATLEPSYVLKAMGQTDDLAYASLRFALGKFTTAEEIDFAVQEIKKTIDNARSIGMNNTMIH